MLQVVQLWEQIKINSIASLCTCACCTITLLLLFTLATQKSIVVVVGIRLVFFVAFFPPLFFLFLFLEVSSFSSFSSFVSVVIVLFRNQLRVRMQVSLFVRVHLGQRWLGV